jgi:hypothetical protein
MLSSSPNVCQKIKMRERERERERERWPTKMELVVKEWRGQQRS